MKLTPSAKAERERVVSYVRREAKKLKIAMQIPDAIIRDTMFAVAHEIEEGFHDRRRSSPTKGPAK